MIASAKRAASVDRVERLFLVTGACQNTEMNFYLLPIWNRQIVCIYLMSMEAPVDYTALKI